MATLQEEKLLSADEFMTIPVEHAELINGKVVETMPTVFDHDELVLILGGALHQFVRKHKLGRVAGGGSFHTEAGQIRVPHVSFVSTEDLQGEDTSKYIDKSPTLAVEIISQNDTYGEVDEKADEFLSAGTKAVWLVNPRRKSVTVRTPDDQAKTYKIGQIVPGGEVLPGFELTVADLFEE